VCSASKCGLVCDAGYSQCGANCVDTSNDKQNCGQCGHRCSGTKPCVAGECQ
jgi:hypothetical protein